MKKLNNITSTKTSIALSRACVLALFSVVISNATDIKNDIYELRNKNDASSGTFSVGNMRTWSTGGASFTQSYANGTLIFGNTSQNPKKDSSIWFGGEGWQSGLVGYIKAKFEAKDVYLTGTIGAGNAWNTGGGAQLDFKASNDFKADSLNLQLKYAGLQYSNFFVEAKNISFSNSTLNVGGAIKLISEGNISLNSSSITSSGNDIRLNAKNGSITGKPNVNFSAGTPIYVGVIEILAKDKIELGTTKLQVNASSLVGSMQGRIEVKTESGDITFDKLELVGNNGISAFGTYAHIKAGGNLTVKTDGAIYSNRGINNSTDTAGSFSTKLEAGGDITLNNTNIFLLNQLAGIGAPDKMTIIAGGNLTHSGTISFLTNQQTWEGAKLDISGVKGNAKLGNIIGSAFYLNANKNLTTDSIYINARQTNGGFFGTGAQIWTKENGKYTFSSITLGQCGLTPWNDCEWANTARLSFFGTSGTGSNGAGGSGTNSFVKDSTLTIENLNLGTMAGLYASNIQNTNVKHINMSDRATAEFHNLTLQSGGSIIMDATSQIQVKSRAYEVNTTPILGKVTLNVTNGTPFLFITNAGKNLENLNIQAGRIYRFIDAGEIKYKLDNTEFSCTQEAEKCSTIKQNFAIFSGNTDSTRLDSGASNADHFLLLEKAGLKFEKVADYSTIGIKAVAADYKNPYDIDDIRYYIWQKGGDEAVAKIGGISKGAHTEQTTQTRINSTISTDKAAQSSISEKVYLVNGTQKKESELNESERNTAVEKQVTHLESNIFDWFNVLALHQKGVAWTANNMLAYDLSFFEKTAKQLNNTLEQLVSTERKSNAASSVRFASDLAKAQRLVKLSRIDNEEQEYRFAELLAQKRYAASGGVKSDAGGLDFGFLYKFSNRHEFHNNLWANALGSASFVEGGYGTLYGANVGYDRFIPFGENGIILGVVTSYGYGEYNADLLKNKSHNINAGIYSRTMLKNNEIDINAGYTIGLNSEDLVTRQNLWLSSLDQSYKYNTHTINANANYGYIFSTHSSGFVFKPNIGLSYYHIFTGALSPESKEIANADNPNAPKENLALQSPQTTRDLIALNLALETRQYLSKGSYWFVNVGAQKDVYISGGDIYQVRFAGEDSLNYKKSDNLNTFALASAGGEVKIGRRMFVNFSLGGKYGISYKDIGVQANLGSRIVF